MDAARFCLLFIGSSLITYSLFRDIFAKYATKKMQIVPIINILNIFAIDYTDILFA